MCSFLFVLEKPPQADRSLLFVWTECYSIRLLFTELGRSIRLLRWSSIFVIFLQYCLHSVMLSNNLFPIYLDRAMQLRSFSLSISLSINDFLPINCQHASNISILLIRPRVQTPFSMPTIFPIEMNGRKKKRENEVMQCLDKSRWKQEEWKLKWKKGLSKDPCLNSSVCFFLLLRISNTPKSIKSNINVTWHVHLHQNEKWHSFVARRYPTYKHPLTDTTTTNNNNIEKKIHKSNDMNCKV